MRLWRCEIERLTLQAEPGDGLYGLAKPHVIGEEGAESMVGEEFQPCHASGLVGTEFADETLNRPGVEREVAAGAKFVDESAQPSVCAYLVDLYAPDGANALRERDCLDAGELAAVEALQRPQRLAEDPAIYFDPAVAEEYERRALLQQEADFVGCHFFAGDMDDELRLERGGRRGGGVRGIEIHMRGDVRGDFAAFHRVAGVAQTAGAASQECLRLRAVQRCSHDAAAACAEVSQGAEELDAASERGVFFETFRRGTFDEKFAVRRYEREREGVARGFAGICARRPIREDGGERGTFGVVPSH